MVLKFNYKLQSQIKVEFNHKANSIYNRIQPMIAKSKMVKVESQRKSKTHQSVGLWHFTRLKSSAPVGFQGLPTPRHAVTHMGHIYARASWKLELEAGNRAASWELVKSW